MATMLLASFAVAGSTPSPSLSFGAVFTAKGEPSQIHYTVAYRARGAIHWLEVSRDGEHRIVRITDGRVKSYARRRPGDDGYQLTVLDVPRKLRTDIDRTNLYRIGSFIDWFDLGHGLRHPRGSYSLAVLAKGPKTVAPLRPCEWYKLSEGTRQTLICWDAGDRLPMLIAAGDGSLTWRMLTIDTHPINGHRFDIEDAGFVRVNANQDISGD